MHRSPDHLLKKTLAGHASTVILQKQTYSKLLLCKKKRGKKKVPVKVIKLETSYGLTRLSVAGKQSQVQEPDLRMAFTELEGEEFSLFHLHQSQDNWEGTWERG